MAWRTSSSAAGASAISPLRTPRERAWPRPTILSAPSELSSPTTAQTLDVPTSRPTMMEEGSNMFFLYAYRFGEFRRSRRQRVRILPSGRDTGGNRKIQRRDRLRHFLSEIENFAPAAQLLLEIEEAKGDFAGLTGFHDEDFRRCDIDPFQIGQSGHGRLLESDHQLECSL